MRLYEVDWQTIHFKKPQWIISLYASQVDDGPKSGIQGKLRIIINNWHIQLKSKVCGVNVNNFNRDFNFSSMKYGSFTTS